MYFTLIFQLGSFANVTNGPRPNQLVLQKSVSLNINDPIDLEVTLFGEPKSTYESICILDVACAEV